MGIGGFDGRVLVSNGDAAGSSIHAVFRQGDAGVYSIGLKDVIDPRDVDGDTYFVYI